MLALIAALGVVVLATAPSIAAGASPAATTVAALQEEIPLDVRGFRVVEGPPEAVDYYRVIEDSQDTFLRGVYRPPLDTVTLGIGVPENLRRTARTLRWRWRALVLPRGGNECAKDQGDSAASVYVIWKRGLRWYTVKYAWSALAPRGATCDQHRTPLTAQHTVILESGPPVGVWKDEEIDLAQEFRAHFEGGNPQAEVPDLVGIGLLVDGDQTRSVSAADVAAFRLTSATRGVAQSEPAPTLRLPEPPSGSH